MPYEIVVPAAPHVGNRTLLIEPPHFFLVTAARDFVIGPDLLFEMGFSYGTVGYGENPGNRLHPGETDLFLAGLPIDDVPAEFRDNEIIVQFTESLSEQLNVRRTYGYGFSQTAATLRQIFSDGLGTGLFDLTLLHVTLLNPAVNFVPFESVGRVLFIAAEGDQVVTSSERFRSMAERRDARVYEVAGAAHQPWPTNPLDHWMIVRALFVRGDLWVRRGMAPPRSRLLKSAPAGELDPVYGFETGIARDTDGNALGGLRLPDIETHRALFIASDPSVEPFPGLIPGLFGSTVDLSCEPEPRFRDHADYVRKVVRQTLKLRGQGFLLDDDAITLIEEAKASNTGNCPG